MLAVRMVVRPIVIVPVTVTVAVAVVVVAIVVMAVMVVFIAVMATIAIIVAVVMVVAIIMMMPVLVMSVTVLAAIAVVMAVIVVTPIMMAILMVIPAVVILVIHVAPHASDFSPNRSFSGQMKKLSGQDTTKSSAPAEQSYSSLRTAGGTAVLLDCEKKERRSARQRVQAEYRFPVGAAPKLFLKPAQTV